MWECGLRIFKNYRYDAAYTGEWGLEGQALEHGLMIPAPGRPTVPLTCLQVDHHIASLHRYLYCAGSMLNSCF